MTIRQQIRTAEANYARYLASKMDDLYKAYDKASTNKWRAWDYCKELEYQYGGGHFKYDCLPLKVISKNTFVFTAGFEFVDEETGELMFMYITPNYNIAVSVGDCISNGGAK